METVLRLTGVNFAIYCILTCTMLHLVGVLLKVNFLGKQLTYCVGGYYFARSRLQQ